MHPRPGRRNLVLVGLRGCGKTSVGRGLAERLGRPFVDLDDEIARRAGRDVDAFLAQEGEEAFRAVEREVLREAAGREGCIVATGGGAVLGGEAFEALAGPGLVVWLDVPLDELVRRARARPRPALTELGVAEEFARLDALRRPLYEAAADMVLGPADGDPILTLLSRLDPRHDDEP